MKKYLPRNEWMDCFLFAEANPRAVTIFRLIVAVVLGVAFRPRGLEPFLMPSWMRVGEEVFLSDTYRVFVYGLIVLFGLSWRPRLVGLSLVFLLVPLVFLSGGRQSRQLLALATLFLTLAPSFPIWRWGREKMQIIVTGPMWPIRLVQLLLTVVYGMNAIAKTTPGYLSGEVLVALSKKPNFLIDLSEGHWDIGPFVIPAMWLAIGTVVMEYFLAIGFWFSKWRWLVAIIGVLFHVGLLFVIQIYMLGWVSLLLYLSFLLPFDKKAIEPKAF